MKIEYEYIYFIQVEVKRKTSVWHCRNKRSHATLGTVKWYGSWRQYCFFPEADTIFNVGCMDSICSFIKRLEKERKG